MRRMLTAEPRHVTNYKQARFVALDDLAYDPVTCDGYQSSSNEESWRPTVR
jgi:hypothetical protein